MAEVIASLARNAWQYTKVIRHIHTESWALVPDYSAESSFPDEAEPFDLAARAELPAALLAERLEPLAGPC